MAGTKQKPTLIDEAVAVMQLAKQRIFVLEAENEALRVDLGRLSIHKKRALTLESENHILKAEAADWKRKFLEQHG